MAAIWDIEDLDVLEDLFLNTYDQVTGIMEEEGTIIERENASLEQIWVGGAWGDGRATPGEDDLMAIFFIEFEGILDPGQSAPVQDYMDEVAEGSRIILTREINDPPESSVFEQLAENFPEITVSVAPLDNLPERINLELGTPEGATVFNLTDRRAVVQSPGTSFRNLRRIPLEVLRGEVEPEEEEPEDEEDEDEGGIEEIEDVEEVFEDTPNFPSVPPVLRDFATSPDEMEVTVGQKDTKNVPVRDMYPFEVIMATDRPNPPMVDETATDISRAGVKRGVGRAVADGTMGTVGQRGERETPATFPRTGAYIRNYLKFEGPSYALQLHNELLVYTAYVNGIHDFNLRTGTYKSMRRYLATIRQIEEFGIDLIEEVSQQKLAAQGLTTIPDHPTIEGEQAPWLERKTYYTLVDENEDHPAWDDAFAFLEELEENDDQPAE